MWSIISLFFSCCYCLAFALQHQDGTIVPYKECTSIDIRNECESMLHLENCTVVTGYVMIALLPNQFRPACNYENYRFTALREITEFLIFFEVKGLKSFLYMFPNLTVIRGRRLFLNYAFGLTNMPDLELLEFVSLVAIQRGHIYVGSSPKLCQLEKINWNRLTLSPGENHITIRSNQCAEHAECYGCQSDYCWSNYACQHFENDNIVRPKHGIQHCHAQCLGGCYNETNAGCVVCRGLTDHGVCVEKCPADKYLLEQHQRCYTREECTGDRFKHYTFGFNCVAFCPSGYKVNQTTHNCDSCTSVEACISTCPADRFNEPITIYNLADADDLRGCQIVNTSLIITIRNRINEPELIKSFASIREIRGHLKIFRSSYITSLKFLSNLQLIHGDPLENDHFGIILYDNRNLRELWQPTQKLELLRGGLYMHRNNKLCNQQMKMFQGRVQHDKMLDSLQTSDQEVLCEPAKLDLSIRVLSQRELMLSWPMEQTSEQIELIYKAMPIEKHHADGSNSDLDAAICLRINWQRRLFFSNELRHNGTHYTYRIDELQQFTRYGCLVRTFGSHYARDARSDLLYATTEVEVPTPPGLSVGKKTNTTLSLNFYHHNRSKEMLDYYAISIYELPDDISAINKRNYCKQPSYLLQDMDKYQYNSYTEDYDECCARRADCQIEQQFIDVMRETYSCRSNKQAFCLTEAQLKEESHKAIRHLHIPANMSSYILSELQHYKLYALHMRACNKAGCSSTTRLNTRTNYTVGADFPSNFRACRVHDANQYYVRFNEPKNPNGIIVSYVLHYRSYVPQKDHYKSQVSCLAHQQQWQEQYAQVEYLHIDFLNETYNQCAVRIHSLAGDVLTDWVNITICTHAERSKTHVEKHGINLFLLCFLVGGAGTLIWIFLKRRSWRHLLLEWRRLMPNAYMNLPSVWFRAQFTGPQEDREVLVEDFETVHFQHNVSEDN